ncbi:MAG: class I SAM-dependent methyltransferase [Anaerolineae bacterium]
MSALAPVYDRIGLSAYARHMTQRLVHFAQQNEWLGRRVLDLGCGTGAATIWFAEHGYSVTGIDSDADMLEVARTHLETKSLSSNVVQMDLRTLTLTDTYDMVVALDVLNELENVRELEMVFGSVLQVLKPKKWFMFDLHTLEGLAQRGQADDSLLHEDAGLVVFARPDYDFERQFYTVTYDLFLAQDDLWRREKARRTLRAYPVQAVMALLRRQGFELVSVMDDHLRPVDAANPKVSRVVFCVKRR